VVKAYTTRIGTGPFPTEFEDKHFTEMLREAGGEYGATTGRPRRMGWLDMDQLRYACEINGVTNLALTKLDVLSCLESVFIKDGDEMVQFPAWKLTGEEKTWDDLPKELTDYIEHISSQLGIHILLLGVGQGRDQLIWVE
jgi:adenylosuccinate synthase